MESLETSINYWEDALALYSKQVGTTLALTSEEEAEFSSELQKIVEAAYNLQEMCELLFLDQVYMYSYLVADPRHVVFPFSFLERRGCCYFSRYKPVQAMFIINFLVYFPGNRTCLFQCVM